MRSEKMKLTVKKILEIVDGNLICGKLDLEIESYSKDTRTIKQGDCYIGIKGENFNGNDYFREAKEKGAIACIVDEFRGSLQDDEDFTIIHVKDSVVALQKLAKYVREQLNIPVIGVTGSVGKTSTKDMIAKVLEEKYKVLKTPGNLNGQIGLPLTILSYKDEDALVIEMGMNNVGEMSRLTNIAKPTIAVFTNIGTAHIGLLGSRENILKAKLEILEGMKDNSDIIINNDNDLLSKLDLQNYQIHKCSMKEQSDYYASNIQIELNESDYELNYQKEKIEINLPVMGEVFVLNSLLAASVGNILGLTKEEIKRGLESVSLSGNRMEINELKDNITLINDTYNSNYEAVVSALNILASYKGARKIAVLGDILEMENFGEEIHRRIGSLEVLKKINAIFLCGENSKYIMEEAIKQGFSKDCIFHFENTSKLEEGLTKYLEPNDTVLMKASKSMHFKELADDIKEKYKKD